MRPARQHPQHPRRVCIIFGLGEHHRADFAISSPEVVLAAIAARTKQIRLGSAVTVLSSVDHFTFNWHIAYVYKDDVAPLLPDRPEV